MSELLLPFPKKVNDETAGGLDEFELRSRGLYISSSGWMAMCFVDFSPGGGGIDIVSPRGGGIEGMAAVEGRSGEFGEDCV